jgi:hypothetical protein
VSEKPYIGMLGYKAEGEPFMVTRRMNTDDARRIAGDNDLCEYVLVPHHDNDNDHLGYIRVGPRRYKKTFTRIAVFRNLLDHDDDWIPTDKELETAEKFD